MLTNKLFFTLLLNCCLVFLWTEIAQSQPRTSVKTIVIRAKNPEGSKSHLTLPFAFPSETMGFVAGVGSGVKGYGQEQLLVGGTVFGSFDEAAGLFLGLWDYQPSFAKRFFLSAKRLFR